MKILVVESSPHKRGASNLLAEHFIEGAKDAGHQITIFDAVRATIAPCRGCGACGMDGPCVQRDDMAQLREQILKADMMVWVTPLYYFGMSAQLKKVIDRLYAFNGELSAKKIKTAFIVAAWDRYDWTMKDIKAHYETLCNYLHFDNQGMVLGVGCGSVAMAQSSPFPKQAYELGRSLERRDAE